ncbi:MAG: helix-turn-helix domain-containing protein [Bacteroidota bacterium]
MSFIGKNIRKIRTLKKLSQAEFADSFNLARASVGAYEEGRADPKIDTLVAIAKKYNLSIDLLITRELTLNDLVHFDSLHDQYSKQNSDRPKIQVEGLPYISIKNHLEYVVRYKKNDFIDNLPQLVLPEFAPKYYRSFQLNGSEMEYNQQGLHHGDLLIAYTMNLGSDLSMLLEKVLVIVTQTDIIIRRLKKTTDQKITLKTDDPNYPMIELNRSEINELWEVKAVLSNYINPPKLIEEKVLELEKRLLKLEEDKQP